MPYSDGERKQRGLVLVQKTVSSARQLFLRGDRLGALRMLAEGFDGLDEAPGLDPWTPELFLAWSAEQPRDVELVAYFVAGVAGLPIACDLHEALQMLDDEARAAIVTWATQPWWLDGPA